MIAKKRINNKSENFIITGMIISDRVIKTLYNAFKVEYFRTPLTRMLVRWIIEYYEKYEKAPNTHIQKIFEQKSEKLDEELTLQIEDYLASISKLFDENPDEFNADYVIDLAISYFKKRQVVLASEKAIELAQEGNIYEAEALLSNYKEVSKLDFDYVNPFTDKEAIRDAFEYSDEILLRFPRELGELLNPHFVRGGFISFLAPEKRGKTWWLMEVAIKACLSRRNVLFVQTGDMSEREMILRKMVRLSGMPLYEYQKSYLQPVCFTGFDSGIGDYDEVKNFHGLQIGYNYIKHRETLTYEVAVEKAQKFYRRAKGKDFKLFTFPNSTFSPKDLDALLDRLRDVEGWLPDVIVIDYLDIMRNDYGGEYRHQENEKWKHIRRISQERHALIVSATQTDSRAYSKFWIDMSNFSEDKRKFAHVTGMIGLNQIPAEKELGIMRLNWVVLRSGEFFQTNAVYTLTDFVIGRVCVDCIRYHREIEDRFEANKGKNSKKSKKVN